MPKRNNKMLEMFGVILLVDLAITAGFTVHDQDVTVGGYVCGEHQNAHLYYPVEPSAGKVPPISFAHGYNCPGIHAYQYYSEMHTAIAAAGYFVIVLESARWPLECSDEWKDQIRSMEWAKTSNWSSRINFTRTGILGHSMGGGATYHLAGIASAVKNLSIGAAVALHPEIRSPLPLHPITNSQVPIFFGSGSADDIVSPSSVKSAYSQTTGVPKVFSEISGAVHDEPLNPPWGHHRHTPYVIAMFDCHLKGDKDQCSKVYGNSNGSLCSGLVNMTDCEHANEPAVEVMLV